MSETSDQNKLSHYVRSGLLYVDGEFTTPVLYNAMNRRWLPVDASPEEMERSCFYDGSESTSLQQRLSVSPEHLELTLVPTWTCNLRCSHCFVLHQLEAINETGGALRVADPTRVEKFLDAYFVAHDTKTVEASLVGGEPLLEAETTLALAEAVVRSCERAGRKLVINVTTNLASGELTETRLKILSLVNSITVSIDGDERHHGSQRKAYATPGDSPFNRTWQNLAIAVREFGSKVCVQASLASDFIFDNARCEEFVFQLLKLGVDKKKIFLGIRTPTKYNKSDDGYQKYLANPTIKTRQCCSFRWMSNFTLDPDGVHASYHDKANSRLGAYEDSMESLGESYAQFIQKNMPVLQDPGCLACPVLPFCWGGCMADNVYFKGEPSKHCNQSLLEKRVAYVEDNGLIGVLPTGHIKIRQKEDVKPCR